jgi:hypothetical protein
MSFDERGSGGLIGLVVTLLIGFAIMIYFLREQLPSKTEMTGHRTAIDSARERAAAVELQQRQHERELRDAVQ